MNRRWFFGLAATSLAVIAVVFLAGLERVERTIWVGLQGAAARDPYLAAQRLLEGMGREVERELYGFDRLEPGATVLWVGRVPAFDQKTLSDLVAWVEGGGRLVIGPHRQVSDWFNAGLLPSAVPEETTTGPDSPGEVQVVTLDESGRTWTVEFPAESARLLDPNTAKSSPPQDYLRQRRFVDGQVTLLASTVPFETSSIGERDHAALLWDLVGGEVGSVGPVYLVDRSVTAEWWSLLGRSWWIVVGLAAWVLLWGWRTGTRIGPVTETQAAPRRSLLEHIDASGQLLWRLDERGALLEGLRAAVHRRVAERHPGWLALARRDRIARLASTGGVAGGLLDQALEGGEPTDATSFLRSVRTLDRVWRSL